MKLGYREKVSSNLHASVASAYFMRRNWNVAEWLCANQRRHGESCLLQRMRWENSLLTLVAGTRSQRGGGGCFYGVAAERQQQPTVRNLRGWVGHSASDVRADEVKGRQRWQINAALLFWFSDSLYWNSTLKNSSQTVLLWLYMLFCVTLWCKCPHILRYVTFLSTQ